LVVLVIVATAALVFVPPAPPSVAEFAPQAERQIDASPTAQSSRFGAGDGSCDATATACTPGSASRGAAAATATTSTTSPAAQILKARVRRCVGTPPRQTEDPQSPPCVNYFDGDNGGATAKGVTRDAIRIAVTDYAYEYFQVLVDHFNVRYEFFGRKLQLVKIARLPDQRATAVAADEQARPFAATDWATGNVDVGAYQQELARRNIVSVVGEPKYATAADYRRLAPYAWSYSPTLDEVEQNSGQFVCTSLAGRPARFADGLQKLATRKFAIFVSRPKSRSIPVSALQAELQRCGVNDVTVYDIDRNDDNTRSTATFGRLRSDGVSSIILLAHQFDAGQYMFAAPPDFRPEWILTGMPLQDNEAEWAVHGAAQKQRLFGPWSFNKLLAPEDTPAYRAQQDFTGDADSTVNDTRTAAGRAGDPYFQSAYRALLLLASGIQLAGPNLTPESFARGLQGTPFPNPNPGAAPWYQARVGFRPGEFTMTGDAAVAWWSDAADSYGGGGLNQRGGFCYVGRGTRFSPGQWQDVEPALFDPDPTHCR
jgi:hypothetical protein